MDLGAVFPGRVYHVHIYSVLRWKVLYLHDQLGIRAVHTYHANIRRTGHLLALRSEEYPESGTGVRPQGGDVEGSENILVVVQYDTFAGSDHINSLLGVPPRKDE